MPQTFNQIVNRVCEGDVRYREGAYEFLMEALTHTQKKYRRSKHVTGQQLLEGIRELLMLKFGPMTLTVLNYWGISSTEDFGNIVFNLVENKVLSKTEDDSIEHFQNGYDFQEVFNAGYRQRLARKISRMRSF